jgi:hypothetical protein
MMNDFTRHINAFLGRQRGQNMKLATEISENLSVESQERLFRVFQDLESEVNSANRKSMNFGIIR